MDIEVLDMYDEDGDEWEGLYSVGHHPIAEFFEAVMAAHPKPEPTDHENYVKVYEDTLGFLKSDNVTYTYWRDVQCDEDRTVTEAVGCPGNGAYPVTILKP